VPEQLWCSAAQSLAAISYISPDQSNFALRTGEGYCLPVSYTTSPFRELRIDMACNEAEQLKQQVLQCTSVYLEADEPGDNPDGDAGQTKIVADFAMYALNEAKRKYWFHVNQHQCEPLRKRS
jgi:hypothetical protein